jgi:hypothetical protein
MKYFLATFEILDGEHEHQGAVIFEAETADEAYAMADAEEYEPDTDSDTHYFSFGGDGMTACKNRGCQEISKEQVAFLEQVGLAYRR